MHGRRLGKWDEWIDGGQIDREKGTRMSGKYDRWVKKWTERRRDRRTDGEENEGDTFAVPAIDAISKHHGGP